MHIVRQKILKERSANLIDSHLLHNYSVKHLFTDSFSFFSLSYCVTESFKYVLLCTYRTSSHCDVVTVDSMSNTVANGHNGSTKTAVCYPNLLSLKSSSLLINN